MSEETQEQAMWEAIRQSTEVTDEVFRLAKNYIEQGWAVKYQAFNQYGHPVPTLASNAVSWCALGALEKAAHTKTNQFLDAVIAYELAADIFLDSLSQFVPATNRYHIVEWNDAEGRTKQEILDAFDQAIEYNNEA